MSAKMENQNMNVLSFIHSGVWTLFIVKEDSFPKKVESKVSEETFYIYNINIKYHTIIQISRVFSSSFYIRRNSVWLRSFFWWTNSTYIVVLNSNLSQPIILKSKIHKIFSHLVQNITAKNIRRVN